MVFEDLRVFDLIDTTDNGTWNQVVIKQSFNSRKMQIIYPFNYTNYSLHVEDKLIWKHEKQGCFSVKSAYNFIMGSLVDNHHLWVPGEWMLIWNLKIPHKMKIFLGRLIIGMLQTCQNLVQKGVNISRIFPFCNENFENEWHVFYNCSYAKQVWSLFSYKQYRHASALSLVKKHVLTSLNPSQFSKKSM